MVDGCGKGCDAARKSVSEQSALTSQLQKVLQQENATTDQTVRVTRPLEKTQLQERLGS
jgi:hypothetical protein